MKRWSIVAVAFTLLASTRCSSDESEPQGTQTNWGVCDREGDCEAGFSCVARECVPEESASGFAPPSKPDASAPIDTASGGVGSNGGTGGVSSVGSNGGTGGVSSNGGTGGLGSDPPPLDAGSGGLGGAAHDGGAPCPSGKWCGGLCVALDNPAFGCASTSCAPCAVNATSTCVAGACQIASCLAGFGDCNGDPADGCEVDIASDPSNCSACGSACVPRPNAEPTCSAGQCVLGPCEFGFLDCNGDPADGCETDVTSDPYNCGTCSMDCVLNGFEPSCVSGTCVSLN